MIRRSVCVATGRDAVPTRQILNLARDLVSVTGQWSHHTGKSRATLSADIGHFLEVIGLDATGEFRGSDRRSIQVVATMRTRQQERRQIGGRDIFDMHRDSPVGSI
jgi:hypothetical protein